MTQEADHPSFPLGTQGSDVEAGTNPLAQRDILLIHEDPVAGDIFRESSDLQGDAPTPKETKKFNARPAIIGIGPEARQLIERHIESFQQDIREKYFKLKQGENVDGVIESAFEDPEGWVRAFPTPTQQRILYYITAGYKCGEIAQEIGNAYDTVKHHTTNVIVRMDTKNRDEAVANAIRRGIINPLYIDADIDFRGFSQLTDREMLLHQILNTSGTGYPNRKLAEMMSIKEQAIKNIITSILDKFGVESRSGIRIYEIKRNEALALKTESDNPLNEEQSAQLQSMVTEMYDNEMAYHFGINPQLARHIRNRIYNLLGANSLLEAAGHAVFWGIHPKESIADPEAFKNIEKLTQYQRDLLIDYSAYRDDIPPHSRADFMCIDRRELRVKMTEILETMQVNTPGQAAIIAVSSRLEGYRKKIEEDRQKINILLEDHK